MKKGLKLLIATSFLFISACSGNQPKPGKNYFKEYTFTKEATTKQIQDIRNGLIKSRENIASFNVYNESYRLNGLNEYSSISNSTTTIYEARSNKSLFMSRVNETEKQISKENGVYLNFDSSTEIDTWDSGAGYIFTRTQVKSGGETRESLRSSKMNENMTSEKYKESAIESLTDIDVFGKCYINNDGSFTFIETRVTKNINPVSWGTTTKESKYSSKSQSVMTVSKEYKFLSYYSYTETKSNINTDTGEWFNKEKITNYSYSKITCNYAKRNFVDIESFNNYVIGRRYPLDLEVFGFSAAATVDNFSTSHVNTENEDAESCIVNRLNDLNGVTTFMYASQFSNGVVGGTCPAKRFEIHVTTLNRNLEVVKYRYHVNLSNLKGTTFMINLAENQRYYLVYYDNLRVNFVFNIEFDGSVVNATSITTSNSYY